MYGEDDRQEASLHPDSRVRELSKSVAAMFYKSHLKRKDELYEIVFGIYGEFEKFCREVPFQGQPSASNCTAFLVAPNKVMTAGHCISTSYHCSSTSFVFDYNIENVSGPFPPYDRHQLATNDVYNCKKVIRSVNDKSGTKLDYAIIELDRNVEGRTPLKLRTEGKVENRTSVFMIGTPSGLPLKVADQANIFENSDSVFFRTDLDAFHNNSGSPVFNAKSFEVEGVLVRGRPDYQTRGLCKVLKKCTASNCSEGEEVTRILRTDFHSN
ncbi:hypothetical protein A9Q84_16435 [Halobacteriovorax marinus]|uniref:Serine protease n=1 Tax=Halobacteriovorax marinus TaxID=97084 RepID=A0A1Y5FA50_9BACT|nr:hypothetical protein A9Q84_16435 [Halobacteriovorax marinus]